MTAIRSERPWPNRPNSLPGVAASIVVNVGFILLLSFAVKTPEVRPASPPPLLYLEIEPRPLLPQERPRQAARAVEPSTSTQTQVQSQPHIAPQNRAVSQDRPSPPRPRLSQSPPRGSPPAQDGWRVDPNDRSGAMARTLRQGLPGCATPQLLNEMERRNCDTQFTRRAKDAAPITGSGDARRDAEFARQGARRLAEWERKTRPLSGGVGVVGPADCVGSNFGTGCAGAHLGPVPGTDMTQGARTSINPGERPSQD